MSRIRDEIENLLPTDMTMPEMACYLGLPKSKMQQYIRNMELIAGQDYKRLSPRYDVDWEEVDWNTPPLELAQQLNVPAHLIYLRKSRMRHAP